MIIRPTYAPVIPPSYTLDASVGGLPWQSRGGAAPYTIATLVSRLRPTLLLDERSQTSVSGALSTWANQGSAGGSFSQSTAANRPALDSTINGYSAANFDGTNDALTTTLTLDDFITSGAWLLLAVLLPDTHDAADGAASAGDLIFDGGTRVDVALHVSGAKASIYNGTATIATGYAAISNGTAQLVEAYAASGTLSIRVGSAAAVTTTGTLTNDVLTSNPNIGDRGDVGKLDGKLACLIVCDVMPSAKDLADARAFLHVKYGVAV